MRLLSLFALILVFCAVTEPGYAAISADQVLAARYQQLQADLKPEQAVNRHRKLMETANQYLQLTDQARIALQRLEGGAGAVIRTGLMFETSFDNIKQFQQSIGRIANHPSLQALEDFMEAKSNFEGSAALEMVSIASELSKTLNNRDLPAGAKKTLMALQSVGLGFQKLGDVPFIGAALEGYGEIIGGLAGVMNNLAKNATATKRFSFDTIGDQALLKGLDLSYSKGYLKTPVWHYGLPLVEEMEGVGYFYLQRTDGSWQRLDRDGYRKVIKIITDYQIERKKPIDQKTLWKFLKDTNARRVLASSAEDVLMFQRIDEILGNVQGEARKSRLSAFAAIETKIINWHKKLHLPLTHKALANYIRAEYETPGFVSSAVRRRVVAAYPEFKEYLKYIEVNGQQATILQVLDLFADYVKGKHLVAKLEVLLKDSLNNAQLADAVVEIRGPVNKRVRAVNGRVLFEELPPGKYQVTIRSEGYTPRSNTLILEPMQDQRGKVALARIETEEPPQISPKEKADKPKKEKEVAREKPVEQVQPVVSTAEEKRQKAFDDCYKKHAEVIARARASNAANDPSGSMGLVLLYATEQCKAQHKKCQDEGIQAGAECRRQAHPGLDFNAINKKCNTIVGTKWKDCAQQEISCSAQAYKAQCQQ